MDLARVKRLRAAQKGGITKRLADLDDVLKTGTFAMVTARRETIEKALDKVRDYDDQILNFLTAEEELTAEVTSSMDYVERIEVSLSNIVERINELKRANTTSDVKLPLVQLPTFTGVSTEWTPFWDLFKTMIHDKKDLSNIQKLTYLKGQLSGQARMLVDGLSIESTNYQACVNLLQTTYGRPDMVKSSHIRALLNINAPSYDHKDLTDFLATFECHLQSLAILNLTLDELFSVILLDKLPSQLREIVKRAAGDQWLDIEVFRRCFRNELDNMQTAEHLEVERSHETPLATATFNVHSKVERGNSGNSGHSGNYGNSGGSGHSGSSGKFGGCKLCDRSDHTWFKCIKYKTSEAKVERIKSLKLCFKCLGRDHFSSRCSIKLKPCFQCGAHHFHHLCLNKETKLNTKPTNKKVVGEGGTGTYALTNQCASTTTSVLSTVQIPFSSKGKKKYKYRAFLDQGSQVSFVRPSVLQKVKHEVLGKRVVRLRTYHNLEKERTYDVVKLFFASRGTEIAIECLVDDNLPECTVYRGLSKHIKDLEYKGYVLADDYNDCLTDISVLIGIDNYYKLVHPGFKRLGELVLIPTKFGYTLSGKYKSKNAPNQVHNVSVLKIAVDSVNLVDNEVDNCCSSPECDLSRMWELDHIGISTKELDEGSYAALKHFEDTISYSELDQQYIVRLPWKEEPSRLPNNYGLALGRLKNLQNRFRKDSVFCEHYVKVMAEQIERGFVERVPDDELCFRNCHYLPHHGVTKVSTTTPIRTVFDCSAKTGTNSCSLNDLLYTGPSLIAELCQVLLRLRLNKYVAVGDIEKAFLMIQLHADDRDYTRFLWLEDPVDPDSKIVVLRFKVVLFGATCSQFLLNATILKHLNQYENCEYLRRGLYVDNLQLTAVDDEELSLKYWQAQEIFSAAHLYLREWVTNNSSLYDQLSLDNIAAADQTMTKILGMNWRPNMDELGFQNPLMRSLGKNLPTKREVLSVVSRIFDPLGLLLPITIRGRLFMQELWRRQIGWDELVPECLIELYRLLIEDLSRGLDLTVKRQILPSRMDKCDLHAFADASSQAYGASIYAVYSGGARLITAKARVAPIKELTIPKMELTAILLAARLLKYTMQAYSVELKFGNIFIWSDSQIALNWVRITDRTLPVYIRNRVNEIKILLPQVVFRYVPTADNPADLISRGVSAHVLKNNMLWWQGPSWLPFLELWPQWIDKCEENLTHIEPSTMVIGQTSSPSLLIEWDRIGTYEKLLRTMGWIGRFVKNMQRRIKGDEPQISKVLHLEELRWAEKVIVRTTQYEEYSEEIRYLQRPKGKSTAIVKQLGLILDEDRILHCKGRLKFANLSEMTKSPVLLPRNHRVTNMIVERAHRLSCHYGINYVMTVLRQNWWIPRMRQCVKRVIGRCIVCKRWNVKAFPAISPPDLPSHRVNRVDPFQVTGVDYTGALTIRDEHSSVLRKVYIVLFTCAVTRAIHIEVANDLTSSGFLKVFRRFCGRRSFPKVMMSDHASYFEAASRYLSELMEDETIINYLTEVSCKWQFIPARAPWFGAIWERCIGTVKTGLRKVMGRAMVTYDELYTVLVELEAVINDRPLTYQSGELQDPEALTPSHLLNGRRLKLIPSLLKNEPNDHDFIAGQRQTSSVQSRYLYICKLSNDLWHRWSREYLTSLRSTQGIDAADKWPLKGDLVLIHDEGARLYWRLGIVIKLFEGIDGKVRVIQLRTATGITTRPVTKLYPLELNAEESCASVADAEETGPSVQSSDRPLRLTAQAARQTWRDRLHAGQL